MLPQTTMWKTEDMGGKAVGTEGNEGNEEDGFGCLRSFVTFVSFCAMD